MSKVLWKGTSNDYPPTSSKKDAKGIDFGTKESNPGAPKYKGISGQTGASKSEAKDFPKVGQSSVKEARPDKTKSTFGKG